MTRASGSKHASIGWAIAVLELITRALAPQAPYRPPFGAWSRLHGGEPILTPQGDGFEAKAVFNPAVVRDGERRGASKGLGGATLTPPS